MSPLHQLFRSFEGLWKIQRVISTGEKMAGTATFKPCAENPDTLKYHERGQLTTPSGIKFDVFRDYEYRFDQKSNAIDVLFSDGRHFHTLIFGHCLKEAQGHHLCIKDNYNARYQFIDPETFELSYQVIGPKKDYSITSQFTKQRN